MHVYYIVNCLMFARTLLSLIIWDLMTCNSRISPVFDKLTILHSERPKLYAILVFLSAVVLKTIQKRLIVKCIVAY